ncbi:MAG: hypothetical protein NWF04_10500 [Candidatus Bathyarchaeota archaeon]|nr:hypothetical protein [Candidatus Bathyarchaeota archaeon]
MTDEEQTLVSSGRRKMLAARDDLADKIGKIAARRGFTVFSMVNDLLDLAIKVDSMGVSLKDAVSAYELAREVKEASFTLVLENLLYDTTQLAYDVAADQTKQIWFNSGVWVAQRYLARDVDDPIASFERELKAFGWNIPQVNVERSGNMVSARILSPRFSESYTILFNRYLEGFLTTLGYELTFNEVGRGNIRLEAVKRGN